MLRDNKDCDSYKVSGNKRIWHIKTFFSVKIQYLIAIFEVLKLSSIENQYTLLKFT